MSTTPLPSAPAPLGSLPGDASAGLAAYTAAGLGAVAAAALGVMYGMEVPRGGPYVFGAVNDFTGGLFFAASIPAIVQIHRRLTPGPWSRAALGATVTASAGAAASGVLLSLGLIGFAPSTVVSVAGIFTQAAWTMVANHRLAGRPPYPRRLALAGRAVGAGMLVAVPVVGAGLAASDAPALQTALFALGGAVGGAAYLAWPVWLAFAGRRLTGAAAHRRPARGAAATPA
ncbi:hypothetical protein [Sinomonas flava]|uniref:Uncharacterized protein n=1 Tax=Sinomonas flava TaxID=496857 RepID=A0ABP5NUB8_9MICC